MQYIEIQNKILEFFDKLRYDERGNEDKFFSLSDAVFCAEDSVRNKKFFDAIKLAINDLKNQGKEIIAVDAGSGTGILGLFALTLGADKVYFIEINPVTLDYSRQMVKKVFPEFYEKSEFFVGDARLWNYFPQKPNLIISETITVDLGTEHFVDIIKNLSQHCDSNCIIIPQKFNLFLYSRPVGNNYSFLLSSEDIIKGKKIKISKGKYLIKAEVFLYKDIKINSGEAMSFVNPREIEIGYLHPVFEVE